MATAGDLTVGQDGGQGNVKIHPYLVTLVRWCVSCLWSTATVVLHRLMTTPLQPITGPKPPGRARRPAGSEHLHPEPRVRCQLLHRPAADAWTLDVVFVHGLYGSLGNTWRQGDWRQKYKNEPQKVLLRNHPQNTCGCHENSYNNLIYNDNKCNDAEVNDTEMSLKKINEKLSKKVIPKENDLITEQFYNNTLVDQADVNYGTQGEFVNDLFKKDKCDNSCDVTKQKYTYNNDNKCNKCNYSSSDRYLDGNNGVKCYCDDKGYICDYDRNDDKCERNDINCKYNDDKCERNEFKENKCEYNDNKCEHNDNKCEHNDNKCEYNDNKYEFNDNKCEYNDNKCDFNEINDSNECKCNPGEKKCEAGCGCLCNECYSTCWPRDWIKVDFPGARVISINYTSDPYLWRPLWIKENKRLNLYQRAEQMIEQLLALRVGERPIVWVGHSKGGLFIKQIYCEAFEAYLKQSEDFEKNLQPTKVDTKKEEVTNSPSCGITADNIDAIIGHFTQNEEKIENGDENNQNGDENKRVDDDCVKDNGNIGNGDECVLNEAKPFRNVFGQTIGGYNEINDNIKIYFGENNENTLKNNGDGTANVARRAWLWRRSRGAVFYSVPHRGSPLADIKTPVTARSVDLLEIAKDCPLVLSLQARWEAAASHPAARLAVASLVETCRTLMSVLWLRIVSPHSADAGIGRLSGVSVDHREICKPSSRRCLLYTELTDLIREALKCKCQ